MLTPKTVTETTPIIVAHRKQRDLVRLSLLTVPDENTGQVQRAEREFPAW